MNERLAGALATAIAVAAVGFVLFVLTLIAVALAHALL